MRDVKGGRERDMTLGVDTVAELILCGSGTGNLSTLWNNSLSPAKGFH